MRQSIKADFALLAEKLLITDQGPITEECQETQTRHGLSLGPVAASCRMASTCQSPSNSLKEKHLPKFTAAHLTHNACFNSVLADDK
jgi:hypothetical protein